MKPRRGVKSIVPSKGGTNPRNKFRYGSVTCLRIIHGFLSHLKVGNQLRRTLRNNRSKYNLIKLDTAFVISKKALLPLAEANGSTTASCRMLPTVSRIWAFTASPSSSWTFCRIVANPDLTFPPPALRNPKPDRRGHSFCLPGSLSGECASQPAQDSTLPSAFATALELHHVLRPNGLEARKVQPCLRGKLLKGRPGQCMMAAGWAGAETVPPKKNLFVFVWPLRTIRRT